MASSAGQPEDGLLNELGALHVTASFVGDATLNVASAVDGTGNLARFEGEQSELKLDTALPTAVDADTLPLNE